MELEPFITAGAAVAFSVAGYLMSNQRSKQKGNLRATRSESDLKKMGTDATTTTTKPSIPNKMGTDAALPKNSGVPKEAAFAFDNSEGSKPVVPTNSLRGFVGGLNIISTDGGYSNVLQRRICITPLSLPPLVEVPEEQNEAEEEENTKETEPGAKIETGQDSNLEKEKVIRCDQVLSEEPLEGEEIILKPDSLFPTETAHIKTKTTAEVERQESASLEKEQEIKHTEILSKKTHSMFPAKVIQLKKEPETKFDQGRASVRAKNQATEWSHKLVRDLLEEDDSDEEEEIKYLHMLPQTLLQTENDTIPVCPPCIEQPKNYAAPKALLDKPDDIEKEKEIELLRALAETLLERERSLEVQMLEYYGLKEQEEAMKEMENMLKANSTEAKFLSHKVESLQEENERLKNKISELEKVTNKLDRNKEKIKMLKKRLRSEDDNAQEKITLLRESIVTLTDKEDKSAADYEEIERKLERVKELEEELNQLKWLNARLEEENSGLAHQLENVQSITSSTTGGPEEKVLEEATRLKETNEKLEQEIVELRNVHSLSIEEVVYLRWLNACLRHELKHPSKAKGVASELNKSPSYHSREKVKQLIQEYSNLGIDINETDLLDLDFDYSSSQPPSTLSTPRREQIKHSKHKTHSILGKIKKIVTGKVNSNADKDKDRETPESASVSCSDESSPSSSITTLERFPRSEKHPRASLNIVRPSSVEAEAMRSNSDIGLLDRRGEPRRYHALPLGDSSPIIYDREKEDLKKLALALEISKPTSKR